MITTEVKAAPLRVLVLNPPSRQTENVIRDVLYGCWCNGKRIGGGTVPPFGLLSMATAIRDAGFEVTFLDAMGEHLPLRFVVDKAIEYDVVVCSTSTMTVNEDCMTLQELKQANPALRSAIFGSHATFMPEHTLAKGGVDFIIRQEPEFAVRDLLRAMAKNDGSEFRALGIGYKDAEGQSVMTADYPFIENLDDLPIPDVDMLPKNVEWFNPIVRQMPYVTTFASRGCPAKCTFCTAPYFYGANIRYKSVDRMVAETKYYLSKGFKELYFRDETFTANKAFVMAYCQRIIDEGLKFTWIANARVVTVDEEMLLLMKKAGCHLVKFGVESGVQELLDNVRKGIRLEDTRKAFKLMHQVGIDSHAHMMLGIPGETEATIDQTLRFIKEIDPTTVTFGICTPYPGTPLYDEVAKVHPEIRDGSDSDLGALHKKGLFNSLYTELESDSLEGAIKRAYREFYARPKYIMESIGRIKSTQDVKRVLKAGTKVLDFAVRGE
jgi:anaerobic magnesium-protoporphyrin IX monomethyl ester cyclase